MANNDNHIDPDEITEGLFTGDSWNPFDFHLVSYVKSPIQLRCVSSKTSVIGRALRHTIVDLLDNISHNLNEHIENETTIIGTEHRLYHLRRYTLKLNENERQYIELNDDNTINFEISSLAPTVFYQLREDIGISNNDFRQSFSTNHLKDFTNPGKSGSLMYKTFDNLFILKTLREYEARLLMQILSGYHLQLIHRPTIFNRYIGLYLLRFPTIISTIEIYIVIMANAFTPSLQINEIFDLKGSTIKRKLTENLSITKLHNLKDLDFIDLYPNGIRIPTNIYHRLRITISNDVKVLKKLNITDYSLILGIRYIDMTEDDIMQRRPSTGIAALFHMSNHLVHIHNFNHDINLSPSHSQIDLNSLPVSYLKPLKMIDENIDKNFFYHNDSIACHTLPIPGIVNKSNERIYLYLAIIDILQTYDSIKFLEQTLKKLTDPNRHQQYSVISPDEYEKRIIKFLFESVFTDAGDDFPWIINDISKSTTDIDKDSIDNHTNTKKKTLNGTHHHKHKHKCENNIIEFRL